MAQLDGDALVAGLLRGGGLRLLEALRVRVKNVDFEKAPSSCGRGVRSPLNV